MLPYILLTVHRRYEFLKLNLDWIAQNTEKFQEKPRIVIVWACPESREKSFAEPMFDEWKQEGLFDLLVHRQALTDDSRQNISVLESANIRQGILSIEFDRMARKETEPAYVIMQTSDVYVGSNTYGNIDQLIKNEEIDFLGVKWRNNLGANDSLHTNFYAFKLGSFLPALSDGSHDVLEVQLWRQLWRDDMFHSTVYLNNDEPFDYIFHHSHDLADARDYVLANGFKE